jgi:hypothetical protein
VLPKNAFSHNKCCCQISCFLTLAYIFVKKIIFGNALRIYNRRFHLQICNIRKQHLQVFWELPNRSQRGPPATTHQPTAQVVQKHYRVRTLGPKKIKG